MVKPGEQIFNHLASSWWGQIRNTIDSDLKTKAWSKLTLTGNVKTRLMESLWDLF
jgi:hypothetical protein